MLKIEFSCREPLLFDPLRAKFFDLQMAPITIQSNTNTDPDCSKVQNQMHAHLHANTRFAAPRTLRISLGHACNFKCKYCAQIHQKKSTITLQQRAELLHDICTHLDLSKLNLIQFWGGEPLLYWDSIVWLMKEFRAVVPKHVGFSMVTNGSLMTEEITDAIIAEDQFGFILSHDGPGQELRGKDPLMVGTKSRDAIVRLAKAKIDHSVEKKYTNQGRNFAVNPVITSSVGSLSALVQYYDRVFGMEIPIAEAIPVVPINPGTEEYVLFGNDLPKYTKMLTDDLLKIGLHRFDNYRLLHDLFLQKVTLGNFKVNPVKALCFTTDPYMLTIDLQGTVLPCQTFSQLDTFDNGEAAQCGDISQIADKKLVMPTVHGYQSRGGKCDNCPIVSFCMGGCPYLTDEKHEIDCRIKYHHFLGLLNTYLTMIFGDRPTKFIPTVNF